MSRAPVKSAVRVLSVLEHFEQVRRPQTANQVAVGLGLPKSSTFEILRSLVELGYMDVDGTDLTYFPSSRLEHLTSWMAETEWGLRLPPGFIDHLTDGLGDTVTVSVQSGLKMKMISINRGSFPLTLSVKPGDTADLFTTAVGQAALSLRGDAEIEQLVLRARQTGEVPGADLKAILAAVGTVRKTGFAVAVDTYVPGLAAIAWPMRLSDTRAAHAVAVAGPTDRIRSREAEIRRTVHDALDRFHLSPVFPRV